MRARVGKRGASILALFLLLLLPPGLSSAPLEEGWRWKGPGPGGCRIHLPGASGVVHVTGVEGADSIEVSACEVLAGGGRDAASLLDQTRVAVTEEDGVLLVEVRVPEKAIGEARSFWRRFLPGGGEPHLWIELSILLPATSSCAVQTERADVDLRDLKNGVDVRAVSGNVRGSALGGGVNVQATRGHVAIDDVEGDLTLHSTSGEIEAWRVSGSLQASGTSGAMYLYDISGRAEVRGVSGNVLVEECAGPLSIAVDGGNVEVIRCGSELRVVSGKGEIFVRAEPSDSALFHLQSSEGDVDLAVPGEMRGRIEATTRGGAIQCFLPIVIEQVTPHSLVGIAGEGGAWVRLETGGGTIRISRTD